MERRLIIMRHAKSSWTNPDHTDHERPLNPRGQRQAPLVGAALSQLGWIPDLVLSSDAQRTRETFEAISTSWPEVEVRFLSAFYLAGPEAVEEVVCRVPDEIRCLLVLGHNPSWEELVRRLVGAEIAMKTSTAALLTRDLPSWSDAFEPGSWKIDRVLCAKDLAN